MQNQNTESVTEKLGALLPKEGENLFSEAADKFIKAVGVGLGSTGLEINRENLIRAWEDEKAIPLLVHRMKPLLEGFERNKTQAAIDEMSKYIVHAPDAGFVGRLNGDKLAKELSPVMSHILLFDK